MRTSIKTGELTAYLVKQLNTFFPDRRIEDAELHDIVIQALERVKHSFSHTRQKNYWIDGAPAADQLLELCLAVEHDRGRSRRPTSEGCGPPEPRVLDVDVLMIGEHIIENSSICVPHPRMQTRRFFLAPLAEIAPQARHPVAGETIGDMLTALPERERVWLLAPPPGEAG